MERRESRPLRALDSTGTPRTGRTVFDAVMPGRCAAPPAPAMITSIPRFSAAEAYSKRRLGVRWAETTRVSCGTPRPVSVREYGKTRGLIAGNFRELRGGNGSRNARRGEDDLGGMREKKPSYFVDGFIAKGGVDQPDFAAREVLFEEMGEFAGGAGIVRTIEVNGRVGLQFF